MAKKRKKQEAVEAANENEVVEGLAAEAFEAAAAFNETTATEEAEMQADAEAEKLEALSEENSAAEISSEEMEAEGLFANEEPVESFLPDSSEEPETSYLAEDENSLQAVEGSELEGFESADIEDVEFVEEERLDSIVESILFASDRPVSLNQIKMVFKGTNVRTDKIRRALDRLAVELAGARRGVTLEEVPGGYQLRTKVDNMQFLSRTLKARPFKLSGPALEVLAIVAYKQPIIKAEIDEIRGVESGHLLRALMEKGLCNFEGKSDLPGKPMQYGTTKKFMEIFGLRNLKELPTLSQIDELLPDGIGPETVEEKPTLGQITDSMSQMAGSSYSEGEEELLKITEQLQEITTSSDFFEQEKLRQRQKRDAERAQEIRDAILMNEEVSNRDRNWLTRFDEALQAGQSANFAQQGLQEAGEVPAAQPISSEAEVKVDAFEQDTDLASASFDEAPADDEELAVPYHDDEETDAEV